MGAFKSCKQKKINSRMENVVSATLRVCHAMCPVDVKVVIQCQQPPAMNIHQIEYLCVNVDVLYIYWLVYKL